MKQISNITDGMFQPRPLQEDEYLNEADGLIYCTNCHTSRQHRVQFKDRVMTPTVRCRCQQEAYEKEEVERKRQEQLLLVSRLKANGLQDKSLRDYTFGKVCWSNLSVSKALTLRLLWKVCEITWFYCNISCCSMLRSRIAFLPEKILFPMS